MPSHDTIVANAKVPAEKEVSKDVIRDTTGWIPVIASPMKALPGSLDFYERQIALNDINAPNGIKNLWLVLMVCITSQIVKTKTIMKTPTTISLEAFQTRSAGPIARRTR